MLERAGFEIRDSSYDSSRIFAAYVCTKGPPKRSVETSTRRKWPTITSRVPGAPLRGKITVLRPAIGADADLLVRWHADPEVARYWGEKTYSRKQIVDRLGRPQVDAYIVEADGEPVGYLQAWFGETADVTGLDMFLIPAARGRGLGPDAARTLAQHLLRKAGRTRVTADPELWNESAVRSWTRAGFRPVEEREADDEHQHRWLLMEFDSA
jgi:aminoglycoside 6'-N-acetyltransferase